MTTDVTMEYIDLIIERLEDLLAELTAKRRSQTEGRSDAPEAT